jgi:hypothetical protein
MDCEILLHDVNRRGTQMLEAMYKASEKAGINCKISKRYTATTPWLMSYGLGHPERMHWTNAHKSNGGKLIGWDLGYWDRTNMMRLTIGADHPWRLIKDMPSDRFIASGLKLSDNHYHSKGHILLIGMGIKSRAQFGYHGQQWELKKLEEIKKAYPGREIFYRPKKPESFIISQKNGELKDALNRCSLVVCRHSNVAIDAALLGVPAVCCDGAGRCLYSDNLSSPKNPDRQERLRFLQNLAWWQYNPSEANLAWKMIKGVLNED